MRMFRPSNSVRGFALVGVLSLLGVPAAAQTTGTPQAKLATGPYRVAGMVVSKTDGHALARARVMLADVKDSHRVQCMVTGDDGKYEFNGIAAGKYAITAAKRGFITANYDQHDQFSTAIVTGAGLDTEHLSLRLAPDGVISGKILDESGEPVRHATVTLYFDDHRSGVDQIRQSRAVLTNDLGEYEMTPLRPGTYFLSAEAQPWYAVHPSPERPRPLRNRSQSIEGQPVVDQASESPASVDRALDVTYPVTYYPDVASSEEAMAIPIQGGESVEADIHLTPVPSLRVVFRVPEMGENRYTFPQLMQSSFDNVTYLPTGGATQISPGLFEITGVPAGRYDVRFVGQGADPQIDAIDLTKEGEVVDGTKAATAGSVKFSVEISGQAIPQHLRVGLRSHDRIVSEEVDPKGELELKNIAAGHHELMVFGGNTRYSISRISAEGASVSGHALNLASGATATVKLTLMTGDTEIEGKVTRSGKGFAGAMVVLVPKDPELDPDLFRRDQSDLDGTFVLHNVIPGSYTLLAIDNGWDLDWSHPGVIGAYTKQGQKVEVGPVGKLTTKVAESIEVQSK